ncbi:MAG TPA: S8 family serine peptidase, partial [Myxococcota bacterium]|nr:S8 family serine peptidase [Myxococcota bacterium]
MTRLSEAIRSILADRVVTDQEVMTVLAPIINTEGVPDPTELQPLVDAWRDRGVRFVGNAAPLIHRLLEAASYDLERPAANVSATGPGRRLVQPALGAADSTFERLAGITGHRRDTVIVAVGDTGTDFRHPHLSGREWVNPNEIPGNGVDEDDPDRRFPDDVNGWDFVRNSGNIAAGVTLHGNGSAMLVSEGTRRIRVMAMTVMAQGLESYDPLFASIDYAVRKGARVISLATTMSTPENAERLRQTLARHPHILFVMAAGNDMVELTPGVARARGADVTAPNLMVVGAASEDGGVWRGQRLGSNTGAPYVTVAARGVNVRVPHTLASSRNGTDDFLSTGTSLAQPQVANLAAKCMLLSPRMTAGDISRL